MNIDKFGHHVHKRLCESNILFDLLAVDEDSFNFKLRRLKSVKSPISSDDGANKDYVDKICSELCNKKHVEELVEASIQRMMLELKSQLYHEFYTKKDIDPMLALIKNDQISGGKRDPQTSKKELH